MRDKQREADVRLIKAYRDHFEAMKDLGDLVSMIDQLASLESQMPSRRAEKRRRKALENLLRVLCRRSR